MCTTCGCGSSDEKMSVHLPGDQNAEHQKNSHEHHSHHHNHDHGHHHHHHHQADDFVHRHHGKTIQVEKDILSKNQLVAERNRGYFDAKTIMTINFVSSPGSGKTSLLEVTIPRLKDIPVYVIEGDQQTANDALRIKNVGAPVVQINTGTGCHLDADMIYRSVKRLNIQDNSLLFIENIGNLVCPSLFDLGEQYRVVILSVTEGDDKPEKYPTAFHFANVCIINKIDLLPYIDFSVEKVKEMARKLNPDILFFEISAKTGEGIDNWMEWLMRITGR